MPAAPAPLPQRSIVSCCQSGALQTPAGRKLPMFRTGLFSEDIQTIARLLVTYVESAPPLPRHRNSPASLAGHASGFGTWTAL